MTSLGTRNKNKTSNRKNKKGYFQLVKNIVRAKNNKIWILGNRGVEFIKKTYVILCHYRCKKKIHIIKMILENFMKEIID